MKEFVERWGTDPHVFAVTREGIDAHEAAKMFSRIEPKGVGVRGLQAAADPERYNLRDFPKIREQIERVEYRREEITMAEAREAELPVTGDDEWDFEEDDVIYVRHIWEMEDG